MARRASWCHDDGGATLSHGHLLAVLLELRVALRAGVGARVPSVGSDLPAGGIVVTFHAGHASCGGLTATQREAHNNKHDRRFISPPPEVPREPSSNRRKHASGAARSKDRTF